MMDEVGRWLEALGLSQYAAAFSENDIEFDLLADLTEADLERLGVSSLGHRKKLLKAIAALSNKAVATDEADATPAPELPHRFLPTPSAGN